MTKERDDFDLVDLRKLREQAIAEAIRADPQQVAAIAARFADGDEVAARLLMSRLVEESLRAADADIKQLVGGTYVYGRRRHRLFLLDRKIQLAMEERPKLTMTAMAKRVGISRAALYRALKRLSCDP